MLNKRSSFMTLRTMKEIEMDNNGLRIYPDPIDFISGKYSRAIQKNRAAKNFQTFLR